MQEKDGIFYGVDMHLSLGTVLQQGETLERTPWLVTGEHLGVKELARVNGQSVVDHMKKKRSNGGCKMRACDLPIIKSLLLHKGSTKVCPPCSQWHDDPLETLIFVWWQLPGSH